MIHHGFDLQFECHEKDYGSPVACLLQSDRLQQAVRPNSVLKGFRWVVPKYS
jgi:hypothetical protein